MTASNKKRVSAFSRFRTDSKRFGLGKSVLGSLDNWVNRFLRVDCLKIRVLERERYERPEIDPVAEVSCRYATYDDLLRMQEENQWEISDRKLKNFLAGDYCLLSYVGSQLSGYTWMHLKGRPLFEENLRIQVPSDYIYCYASFTASRFRGKNMMFYRRDALMNNPAWLEKRGLFAYVKATNWSSLRGQDKSSYQTIGTMWLIRLKKRYYVWFSKRLKALGLKRLS